MLGSAINTDLSATTRDRAGSAARPSVRSLVTAAWRHLRRASARLDDHWIGDVIGALSLFVAGWIGLVEA